MNLIGLTKEQVQEKLQHYGYNEIKSENTISFWRIFFSQFQNFIIYILLFAVVFSVFTGDYVEAIVILIILLLNALIGTIQEYNAQKGIESIKKLSRTYAKVLRDGVRQTIDSVFLVPGDIIFIETGDKIPADAHILQSIRCYTQEAMLTGESTPVAKSEGKGLKPEHQLFAGTTMVQGSAIAEVALIGMETQVGKIASLIQKTPDTLTPLQKKLHKFGQTITWIILFVALCILAVLQYNDIINHGFSWHSFSVFALVAVSIAVAAVPEALPAVVTIALSVGVKRLITKNVLVRTLPSVETLGNCDVICTDKTGTLTKNEMSVTKAWIRDREIDVTGVGYIPEPLLEGDSHDLLFAIGKYCNNSSVYQTGDDRKISGDPTEAALLVSAIKAKINHHQGEKVDELGFDEKRKMMSVLYREPVGFTVYTKGAPDHVLKCCTHILIDKKVFPLSDEYREKVLKKNTSYAHSALRVLGFAYKNISHTDEFTEEGLIFVGLQGMIDAPRSDVADAIIKTTSAGIKTYVLTGDHKHTAQAVAHSLGIYGDVLTSDDLYQMSSEQIKDALRGNVTIFARIIPQHKQEIIKYLQEMGHTVAMIGDGINDAPALKQADIGIAVETGSDIAKEASDFILLDNSFSNIVNAIEQGRGIYDNIQKSIILLLSGNCGEVLILVAAVFLGWDVPLTAMMILWINLASDGLPAIAYSVDPYNPHIMERAPYSARTPLLTHRQGIFIVVAGILAMIVGITLFVYSLHLSFIYAQTMVFSFMIVYQIVLSFIIRMFYKAKFFSNWLLWFSRGVSLFLVVILLYTPLASIFSVTPLSLSDRGILSIASLSMIVLLFFKKSF